jgi:hypothetical protein
MSGNVQPYLDLVPVANSSKPKFMSMIAATLQPCADMVALINTVPTLFDPTTAVGQQLDWIGQWVGVSRELTKPLTGVYFSFDTPGLGFDEGAWLGPYDPTTGLTVLPDEFYALLIAARILNNHWKGDIPGAYALANSVFAPLGYQILIADNGDLTMDLILLALTPIITPIAQALLTGGFLNIKPIGVGIGYASGVAPLFGFDIENSSVAGFDVGNWTVIN